MRLGRRTGDRVKDQLAREETEALLWRRFPCWRPALELRACVCPEWGVFRIQCHKLMVVHFMLEAFQTAQCGRDQAVQVIAYRPNCGRQITPIDGIPEGVGATQRPHSGLRGGSGTPSSFAILNTGERGRGRIVNRHVFSQRAVNLLGRFTGRYERCGRTVQPAFCRSRKISGSATPLKFDCAYLPLEPGAARFSNEYSDINGMSAVATSCLTTGVLCKYEWCQSKS